MSISNKRGFLIAGNWKMNGMQSDLAEISVISQMATCEGVEKALCLPATLIASAAKTNSHMVIGAQDCHQNESGAHTGCLSASMLKEAGAVLTIVGHSERRQDQHESDSDVRAKALAGKAAGLSIILCIGETEAERDAGHAISRVTHQLTNSLPENADASWMTIAYEPVWAIGTGRIPSEHDVAEMHAAIRARLVQDLGDHGADLRILYGGSMNGENAASLLAIEDVDGGLVGGASLTATKFGPIVEAANALMSA